MLVSAEQLDYDISRRVEESLEKHSHAVPGQCTVMFTVLLVTRVIMLFLIRCSIVQE